MAAVMDHGLGMGVHSRREEREEGRGLARRTRARLVSSTGGDDDGWGAGGRQAAAAARARRLLKAGAAVARRHPAGRTPPLALWLCQDGCAADTTQGGGRCAVAAG